MRSLTSYLARDIPSYFSMFDDSDFFKTENLFTFFYPESGGGVKFDVKEYDDKIEIIAEVLGYSKKDVKIEYDNGILTISGKVEEKKEENVKYLYKEIKSRQFERNFKVGKHLDASVIDAEFKDGKLHVTLPKVIASSSSKTIEIK